MGIGEHVVPRGQQAEPEARGAGVDDKYVHQPGSMASTVESMSDAASLVGLLAEPERLRAFAAVALGAGTADEVAKMAGLDRRAAVVALERLAGRGLIDTGDDGSLRVVPERFKEAARSAAEARRASREDDFGDLPADTVAVLRNFVEDGRLVRIPAVKSKRLVILDWLAGRFDPGRTYPESQVNRILDTVHADVASLRRYLVDEGFLERREGFYWRAGGTVRLDD